MVTGPRQCGKTTLVRGFTCHRYITLDDDTVLEAARGDPSGFVRGLDQTIVDDVQRAPDLLRAIKKTIDVDRRPGRFLLTGSANVLPPQPRPLASVVPNVPPPFSSWKNSLSILPGYSP
jgi:predicted AAA+ superfamily ATPase